jgi:ribosomal protein L2
MGIRIYKPTSAGRRTASVSDFVELTPGAEVPKNLRVRRRRQVAVIIKARLLLIIVVVGTSSIIDL